MMSRVRRGFSTLPIEPEPEGNGIDISGDFSVQHDESTHSYGTPSSLPLRYESAKRKYDHLVDDRRRDSATPIAHSTARKFARPTPLKRQADDDYEESDASGDIFAGDAQVVASHKTYAHHLKKKLGFNHEEFPDPTGRGVIKARRLPAQDDPENHAIKNLRVNEKLSWSDITTLINQERIKKGAVPDLTEAATYSRFVRNAPRIAAQEGDIEFDVKDFMHLKPKEMGKLDMGLPPADEDEKGKRKWSRKADEILVSSYKAAKEEFWMVVAEKFELQSGRTVTPVDCAKRFKLLPSGPDGLIGRNNYGRSA